ncbi:MAG TPA: hypothetical protein VGX76_12055 [Pirellulales bacterium]|nr:hypothetical protein [Pirellulales bacterium]
MAGNVDVSPGSREIRAFKLVTNEARYGDEQFGAVLELAAVP